MLAGTQMKDLPAEPLLIAGHWEKKFASRPETCCIYVLWSRDLVCILFVSFFLKRSPAS